METKKLKFSLPLYPDLSQKFIENDLIPLLKRNKNIINDIYVTVRMPPFTQDAMGTYFSKEDISIMISNALLIQQKTSILISPVFNNKFISPSEENLDLFIENFKLLYDLGIRSCTIPFTSWLMFGKIQKAFPELYIKNTVLHAVDKPRQVYDLFMNGFDYVNLDRNIIRSQSVLKEIDEARKAAEKKLDKKLKLSVLWNENCVGNCPIQEEHYNYNVHNTKDSKVFFKSSMYKISCYKWEKEDKSYIFKKSNIIPTEKYLNGLKAIDVFKLHGRESKSAFLNSLFIVDNYNKHGLGYLQKVDEVFIQKDKLKIEDKIFNKWLDVIENCNFNCWKCDECDKYNKYNK